MIFRDILNEILARYSSGEIKADDFRVEKTNEKYKQKLEILLSENPNADIVVDTSSLYPKTLKTNILLGNKKYLRDLKLLRVVSYLNRKRDGEKFNEIYFDLKKAYSQNNEILLNFLTNPRIYSTNEVLEEVEVASKYSERMRRKYLTPKNSIKKTKKAKTKKINKKGKSQSNLKFIIKHHNSMIRRLDDMALEGRILDNSYSEKHEEISSFLKRIVFNESEIYDTFNKKEEDPISYTDKMLLTKAILKSIVEEKEVIILTEDHHIHDLTRLFGKQLMSRYKDIVVQRNLFKVPDIKVATCKLIYCKPEDQYVLRFPSKINFNPVLKLDLNKAYPEESKTKEKIII